MHQRTLVQNKRLYKLLTETNLISMKADLVLSYTDGRTDSSREMYDEECDMLIRYLQHYRDGERIIKDDPADRMRKKILSACHTMQWYVRGGAFDRLKLYQGRALLDYDRINAYCIKYGYLHKPLMDYTEQELPMLVTQFNNVRASLADVPLQSNNSNNSNGTKEKEGNSAL